MDKVKITIIGAGVVGLAVAYELSKKYQDIVIVEKESSFGQGISSRNSEVIHAGIYYTTGSLKHTLCLEGNKLLYEFCDSYGVPYRKTGKIIVATTDLECKSVIDLFAHARANEVPGLCLINAKDILKLEPQIKAKAGMLSSSTGIIDTHSLMKTLLYQAEKQQVMTSFNSEVLGISYDKNIYTLKLKDYQFQSEIVINSSGLDCLNIRNKLFANLSRRSSKGAKTEPISLFINKGDYFSYSIKKHGIKRLVYPVPVNDNAGLGIHATIDLAGGLRFGPDTEYVDKIDYKVDENKKAAFLKAIKKYFPGIKKDHLSADFSGIRPKLQAPGKPEHDFIIQEETKAGFPGFINLLGIESPGLTACIAIGKKVKSLCS